MECGTCDIPRGHLQFPLAGVYVTRGTAELRRTRCGTRATTYNEKLHRRRRSGPEKGDLPGTFFARERRETVSARDLRTKRDEDKVKGNARDVEARIELIAQSNNRRPYGYKTQATVT